MTTFKHIITAATAAVALLSAGASFADGDGSPERADLLAWKGTKTRAEVRAELLAAQRAGEIVYGEVGIDRALLANFKSEKSRAQVRAETLEARRLGLLDTYADRSEPIAITPAQAEQIRQAGLRAVAPSQTTASVK